MKPPQYARLKFPCDCISSTTACEEPWARVAKEGMFKDGTREEILNRLHEKPRTIAQLAKATKLAQPTIFRHVNDLVKSGLLKEFDPDEKDYVVERYYRPNFPVVSQQDQDLFEADVSPLSNEIANLFAERLPDLKQKFARSESSNDGWSFEEFAHYLVHLIQRDARRLLEEKGLLATTLENSSRDFVFWAKE